METEKKSLKESIESFIPPPEPDLARAVRTIFGDPRILLGERERYDKIFFSVPDLERKKEKLLAWQESIKGKDDPIEENLQLRIAQITESLAAVKKEHPDYVVGSTEAYTVATDEWIAWARPVADGYRGLSEHPECSAEDQRTLTRIATRYDDTIGEILKLCESVARRKKAFVESRTVRKTTHKQMLIDFVKEADAIVDYYNRRRENIGKELADIRARLSNPVVYVHRKRRRRRR